MNTYSIDKNKVHEIMERNNMKTQLELANKLGITKSQLSVILSSKTNPFKSNIQLLCNTLGVSPLEIIALHYETKKVYENIDIQLNSAEESKDNDFVDISYIKPHRKYNVLELFAGAGGLALGLEKAGFNAVGLVEYDKYAAKTLRINRSSWNVIEDDIVNVAEKGIYSFISSGEEVDLISGGFPCQAFSYAGQKRGLDDVRGTMFFYYASILKQMKPKMFLAENVRGLLTHENGNTLKTMVSVFESIGYRVVYNVVKAVNYNVAQKRERLVIIGIREDLNANYKLPKPFSYKPVLRDVLKNVPISDGDKYPPKKKKVIELVPPGGYWRDLPDEIAKEYMGKSYYSTGGRTGMARRISWDEPCLTLTCSPAQKQTERCHPDETRPFTIREYARIQSFPDEWAFYGSTGQQYKQIGNAVPVELAKAVGLSIIDVLNKIG